MFVCVVVCMYVCVCVLKNKSDVKVEGEYLGGTVFMGKWEDGNGEG